MTRVRALTRLETENCRNLTSYACGTFHEVISIGHVTRGNFSCNLSRNKRCETSCKKDFTCNTPCNGNKMLRCELQRKVEVSSTFRYVARQVAACDMSIATCHAILWKLGNQSPSFARRRFQAGGERVVNNFQRGHCKLRRNIANVWHPLCNLQCFSVVIVARQVARKIASCNMALSVFIHL